MLQERALRRLYDIYRLLSHVLPDTVATPCRYLVRRLLSQVPLLCYILCYAHSLRRPLAHATPAPV